MQDKIWTPKNIFALIVSIAIAQGAGLIGSLATRPNLDTWYRELEKPFFTPPDWIFPIVWPILFLLMAVAVWLVWIKPASDMRTQAFWAYGIQLALNIVWSFLFFGLQNPAMALVEINMLLVAILATTAFFLQVTKLAAYLMVPYILWILFAMMLNASIVFMN